jgi:hypothetical protein
VRRLVLPILACLALPATALASGSTVVKDCTDNGRLDKRYSQKEYREALADLPTDVDEYTDCRDVIRKAQLGSAGGGGSGGSSTGGGSGGGTTGGGSPGGGSTVDPATATPQEKAAIKQAAQKGASTPVTLDGQQITPETPGLDGLNGISTIPNPLLVVLALLGLAGVSLGAVAGRKLVRTRRLTT